MSLDRVVRQLNESRRDAQNELDRIDGALKALNVRKPVRSVRILSKAARERIAEAQRQRWAKVRKISTHNHKKKAA